LTFTKKINPTKKQKKKMVEFACGDAEFISPGGEFWVAAVDYKTGKCLKKGNKQKVTAKYSKWRYSNYEKIKYKDSWFEYAKKSSIDVKIVYPKKYKNLVIGVGGYSVAPHWESEHTSGDFSASYTGWIEDPNELVKPFFKGKQAFSETKVCWSKKNKKYAHFMRVK